MVNSEKPALPTLWLDTSVVIKLTKIDQGEKLQEIEVQRCTRLKNLVHDLVRAGKLLCPESDHEEEYIARRLDDDVHRMFSALSLGISMIHRKGIEDIQVFTGMDAYVKGSHTIDLPSSTYFRYDPVEKLEETLERPFYITVGLAKSSELLQRSAVAKAEIERQWEELRQQLVAEGRTYEVQLAKEQRGYINGMLELVRKAEMNLRSGELNFWDYMGAFGALIYRNYWQSIGGVPPDWEGVHKFFCSPYFAELPLPYVSCRLLAELLTGNEPIRSGDPMDAELLSVALPVAHYVLTDHRMKLRIEKLGLDRKFQTEVYSMSSIEGLFERLEELS